VTEAQPTPERLVLDNETWSHRDLAEVISSRYFVLGDDEMGAASWRVRGHDGKDEGDCLVELNRHLSPLGMIGVLDLGNPPVLSISELPSGIPVLPKWQQFAVWMAMFSFMTIAGIGLISRNDPDAQFGMEAISQATLSFSIPLILAVALSSEIRRAVAKRHGVALRGLVPLGFPLADAIWPFGVAGLLPQNRPDQVPYPNRRALAQVELSAPLVTFSCGVLLSIVGLSMTSTSPPGINSAPLVVSANPLLEHLSNPWLGDDLATRLQWLHPTGVAGIGLCAVSWIMMMPIPGFPGDHLLHAIFGPDSILAEDKQTYIFALTLIMMVIAFSSNTWLPWLFLAALATWRRFSPNPLLDPFVVDEHSGLDDISRNRTIAAVMVILVAGFPGINGAYHLQDWDEGLSTESWPEYASFEDGHAEIDLLLEPTGVLPVSGWLQMRVEGASSVDWQINSKCLDERGVCRFDDITQASQGSIEIELSIVPPHSPEMTSVISENMTFRLVVLIDVDGHVSEHSVLFESADSTSSIAPLWELVEDTSTPRICVKMRVSEGDYVNLSLHSHWAAFWSFENETSLAEGTHDLCLRGKFGAFHYSSHHLFRDEQHLLLGPPIILGRDGQQDEWLSMPIEGTMPKLHVSGEEWKLPEDMVSWMVSKQYSLSYVESGPVFCPSTDVIPEVNATGDWVRELADRSSILFAPPYENPSETGTIRIDNYGWLLVCNGTHIVKLWEVTEGPEVLINGFPSGSTFPGSSQNPNLGFIGFTIENRENYSMPLSMELSGDAGIWSMPSSDISAVGPMETLQIEPATTSGCCSAFWVTADEDGITIHYAARSEGVVP